ncbi:MAG: hypothetical protein LQ341_005175, partial [Variospora aurantia]
MSSLGGDSPRPFEASNSQADMTWLDSQQDGLEMQPDETEVDIALTEFDQNPAAVKQEPLRPEFGSVNRIEIDLTEPDHGVRHIKQEPFGSIFGPVNRIQVDLTRSDDDAPVIKRELSTPEFGPVNHIDIDLTGSDNVTRTVVKQEDDADSFHWKDTAYIELSDSEDGDGAVVATHSLGGASGHSQTTLQGPAQDHITVKMAHLDQPASIPEPTGKTLGNSILQESSLKAKRPAADVSRMKMLQALYAAKALRRDKAEQGIGANPNNDERSTVPTVPIDSAEADVEEDS